MDEQSDGLKYRQVDDPTDGYMWHFQLGDFFFIFYFLRTVTADSDLVDCTLVNCDFAEVEMGTLLLVCAY